MSQDTVNLYEGMFVISAKLGETARQDALNKIVNGINSRDGEILKLHDQGRRRLAYEIRGHREGYYYVIYFNVRPSAISEMWQEYHLHEDLVRFITLRTDAVMEKIEFKLLEDKE
jgi:small subunit ribosomal protein S6